jgi:hypothetical protein
MKTLFLALLVTLASAACVHVSDNDRHARSNAGYSAGQGDVLVCHKGKKTLSLPPSAVDAHLGHGDRRGRC